MIPLVIAIVIAGVLLAGAAMLFSMAARALRNLDDGE